MKIELPLDGPDLSRVREASDTVFKSQFLLEILLVIAQERTFYHGQVLGLVPRSGGGFVTGVLGRYETAGLIRGLPTEPGQARRYFEKAQPENPFWTLITGWVEFLIGDHGTAVAQLIRT